MHSLGPPSARVAIIILSSFAVGFMAHISHVITQSQAAAGQQGTIHWSSYLFIIGGLFAFFWNMIAALMETEAIRVSKASVGSAVPHYTTRLCLDQFKTNLLL